MRVAGQYHEIVLQFIMHFRRAAFHRLAVVLHLIEGGRIAETVDHLFAFFTARAGNHDFVGIDFNGPLGDDHVAGEGHDVALHIQRLLIGLDVNRLIGIAGFCQSRQAGGQKRACERNVKAEFVCSEFHKRF